jgi:ATP-binding cassette subfamily B protein
MAANGYHEEEALGKAYDKRLMRRLLAYTKPYRLVMVIAVLLLLLVSVAQVYQARLIQEGVDNYITPGVSDGFTTIMWLFFAVIAVSFVGSFAQAYMTQWLGQRIQYTIRMQVFAHLQRLHLSFYDKNPVGRLVTRVTNDVNTLNEMFSSGVVDIFGDLFMLILIISYMLYINWGLALITFAVVPLMVIATLIFKSKARGAYRDVRTRLARVNAYLQEHITGMSIVQLCRQEKNAYDKFDEINSDLRAVHQRSIYYYALFFPVVELFGAVAVGLVLYYGGLRILASELTLGELVAFLYLVERFFRPLRDLAEKYNILQSSMASSERVFKLLDTKPMIVNPAIPESIPDFKGKIEFKDLWFAYNDEDWVLKNVNFTVNPGEKVAVVGATGAGKTSLVSLLYRFYDYQKGDILIDGVSLKKLALEELRDHLGLVLQDVFLFSGDYARNVRLKNDSISDEQIMQALDRVGYARFLKEVPKGLQGEIMERGATLSTGQKQLLSFARALAFSPEILILDEATSSIDTETEHLIQTALDELLKDRTAIVIAHRLSTIEKADKIIVLHHGEVREIGRHHELLGKKGLYYKLYQMQFKRSDQHLETRKTGS